MSKKPFNPVKQSTSDGGKKNELHVPDDMKNPKWKVVMRGEGNVPVRYYHDLSANPNSNQAVVTLSFDSGKGECQAEDLDEVTYRVVNPKPSSWEEWNKMENEALTDFIIHKSSSLLNDTKNEYRDLNYTLKKDGEKINLLVEKKDGTGKKTIENLQLKGEFWRRESVSSEDFVHIPPRPKPTWWKTTQGKVIIGVVAGTILLLILIFHKKIWGWVKGEKKKSPETIIL